MKKVLLYSGGMDSYILSYLEKPDICLYININGSYSKKELDNLIAPPFGELTIDTLNIGKFERDDLILPMRNAYFVLQAAQYGDEVILGATYGDRSHDKDYWFSTLMELLTNHMWQEQHWTTKRKIKVSLPAENKTKNELLKEFMAKGGDPSFVYESVSCYHSVVLHCGECKACARKWVAMELNMLSTRRLFNSRPHKYFHKYLRKILTEKYRGPKEDREILLAIEGINGGVDV